MSKKIWLAVAGLASASGAAVAAASPSPHTKTLEAAVTSSPYPPVSMTMVDRMASDNDAITPGGITPVAGAVTDAAVAPVAGALPLAKTKGTFVVPTASDLSANLIRSSAVLATFVGDVPPGLRDRITGMSLLKRDLAGLIEPAGMYWVITTQHPFSLDELQLPAIPLGHKPPPVLKKNPPDGTPENCVTDINAHTGVSTITSCSTGY